MKESIVIHLGKTAQETTATVTKVRRWRKGAPREYRCVRSNADGTVWADALTGKELGPFDDLAPRLDAAAKAEANRMQVKLLAAVSVLQDMKGAQQ